MQTGLGLSVAKSHKSYGDVGGNLESTVAVHTWVIIGVVVVTVVAVVTMLVAVGAMIIDSLAEKKAISQDIRDQVKSQNESIESLDAKIESLIQDLRKSNEQETIQKTN